VTELNITLEKWIQNGPEHYEAVGFSLRGNIERIREILKLLEDAGWKEK